MKDLFGQQRVVQGSLRRRAFLSVLLSSWQGKNVLSLSLFSQHRISNVDKEAEKQENIHVVVGILEREKKKGKNFELAQLDSIRLYTIGLELCS